MEGSAAATWFAYIALLAWPLVAIFLFQSRPFNEAIVWTVLGAFLLLPAQISIKFSMVPSIDKDSVAGLSAVVGYFLMVSGRRRSSAGFGLVGILITVYIFTPIVTSVLNSDPIIVGDRALPGVGLYDGISALISQCIIFSPFFIGRRLFQDVEDNETALRALVFAGLFFSLLMLFEIRMSPQLSTWIYGYTPTYANEYRYGGYRPVVFMSNGLITAFFLSTSFLAAVSLRHAGRPVTKLPAGFLVSYLGTVLVLCKSAGALIYAIVGGVVLHWLKPIAQVRFAVLLASIAVLYPVLRMTDYFPDKHLVDLAATFNQERADSLQIRFDQEQMLLSHASQRFLFGWGRYGRSRVYEESGKDSTITDGLWIVTLGQFGFAGFLAQFGLLTLPVFRAASAVKRLSSIRERILLAALTLIVAITVVEQLPNASLSPWSWLLVGSLLGRVERIMSARSPTRSSKMAQTTAAHA